MIDLLNYELATDSQVLEHAAVADVGGPCDEESFVSRMKELIAKNEAVVLKRPYGYALVLPFMQAGITLTETGPKYPRKSKVEVLYINPDSRNQGHGSAFLDEIKALYGKEWPIVLTCFGKKRVSFFEAEGFKVIQEYSGEAFDLMYHP